MRLRTESNTYSYILEDQNSVDFLNAHHFDYRGLIEKGFAIEAFEGMYNLKKITMEDNAGCALFTIMTIVIFIGCFIGFFTTYMIYVVNVPTAMDVYQGKTAIEYIYRDGVAVDSIVIFKEK